MAIICDSLTLIDGVQYGINCVQHSYLPEMTPEARDELLKYIVKIFAMVFIARKVLQIFSR
jgi:hypothetical protein